MMEFSEDRAPKLGPREVLAYYAEDRRIAATRLPFVPGSCGVTCAQLWPTANFANSVTRLKMRGNKVRTAMPTSIT